MSGPTMVPGWGSAPALELTAAWRTHGEGPTAVTALRDVSLSLHEGELLAVMGPSGSGKSTLLNLAGGVDQPTQGDVRIGPDSTVGASASRLAMLRRRHLGFVFQDANLVASLTAGENVALPRELDGIPVKVARRDADAALTEVGLAGMGDRFPDDLSGGQQQRVAIARALVGGRRLILADEPTGALDTQAGDEVLRIIRARCDAGAAALVVTHNPRHAAWADRVLFLRDGAVVERTAYADMPPDAPNRGATRLPLAGLGAHDDRDRW